MAFIPVNMVGGPGLVLDVEPHLLPPNAWNVANNIRFVDGRAARILGHSQIHGALNHAPYNLFFCQGTNDDFWVYTGLTAVGVSSGGTDTDITRTSGGAYAATAGVGWNGGVLHGVLVLNNSVDDPQYWVPDTGNDLAALTGWPASTKAQVIRPFKNFLVALDVTKSGTRYPYMVKWSDVADPGTIPSSWDEADATKLAGEVDLGETPDRLVDCLPLADINVVYKEASMHAMSFVGFPQVFAFRTISNVAGIFTRRCAAQYRQGLHCVLTNDDLIVHDGLNITPIGDKRLRDWIFQNLDATYYTRSFLFHNRRYNEVWICFPQNGADFADTAVIWNYRDNNFSIRDLPGAYDIHGGIVDNAGDETWDGTADVTWDEVNLGNWNKVSSNPTARAPVMAVPDDSKIYLMDDTQQFDGTSFTSTLERTGLAIERLRSDGGYTINTESYKYMRGLRPRVRSDTNTSLNFYVGTQEFLHSPIAWDGPYAFTTNQDYKIDVSLSGRLFGIRVESDDTKQWVLDGYDLDIEPQSMY